MAQPITWQNVNAPQIDTSRGMLVAGSLFNHGFDKIGEVLKQQEAVGNANWDNTKLNNTNAYMEALASAKTPEELIAKQDLLAQLRQSAGAQMDMPAVLKATDLRAPELQQRAVAENVFKNTMQDAAEDPLKRQALAAKLRGDDATYNRILAENPNARFVLDAVDKGRTWDHQNKTWKYEDQNQQITQENHKWAGDLQSGKVLAQGDAHLAAAGALKLNDAQIREIDARPGVALSKAVAERTALALKNMDENSMHGSKQKFSSDASVNVGNIGKVLDDSFEKGNEKGATVLKKYFSDNPEYTVKNSDGSPRLEKNAEGKDVPVTMGYPPAIVKRALDQTTAPAVGAVMGFFGKEKYGEDFQNTFKGNLDKLMQSPEVLDSYMTYQQLTANSLQGKTPTAATVGLPKPTSAPVQQSAPVAAPVVDKPAVATLSAQANTAGTQAMTSLFGNARPVSTPVGNLDAEKFGANAKPSQMIGNSFNLRGAPSVAKETAAVVINKDGSQTKGDAFDVPTEAATALRNAKPVQKETAYKGAIPEGQGTTVLVTAQDVKDGDTFKFGRKDMSKDIPGFGGKYTCRLDLIDAPETAHGTGKGQNYGEESKKTLQDMIANKEVNIRINSVDIHGRNVCQVEVQGKSINLAMIQEGAAMLLDKYVNNTDPRLNDLKAAQATAQTKQVGMFAKGAYNENPAEYRKRNPL